MDQGKLVDQIRKVINKIVEKQGNINMAMLLPDKGISTFTLLISSKWLDKMSPYEGTKLIATYLFQILNENELQGISRVNLINTNDKSLDCIYKSMRVSNSVVNIENCVFFNVKIDKAILFESHKD